MDSLKGKLLIAAPTLADPNFARSVVFLCEHRPEGAMGIVINRPTSIPLDRALPQVPLPSAKEVRVFLGGPVETERMLIIHSSAEFVMEAQEIPPGVYLGAELELLNNLLAGQQTFRIYRGYAGWGQGQLDMEIAEGAWLTAECSHADLFLPEPSTQWQDVLRKVGGVYSIWADLPEHPDLN